MGFRIGVVVDEAHHSFQGQGQAAAFYNEVLAPEFTVFITATPDDKNIGKWKKSCVAEVQRISEAREAARYSGGTTRSAPVQSRRAGSSGGMGDRTDQNPVGFHSGIS